MESTSYPKEPISFADNPSHDSKCLAAALKPRKKSTARSKPPAESGMSDPKQRQMGQPHVEGILQSYLHGKHSLRNIPGA